MSNVLRTRGRGVRTCAGIMVGLFASITVLGSNLAGPGCAIPEARIGVGASYHLGGHTISNDSVPCLMNRFSARLTYSPIVYANFGFDVGATQVEVAGDTSAIRAYSAFRGAYGLSAGGHVKLSTPQFISRTIALVAIAQATIFSSENSFGARYGGIDGNGGVGLQVRVPGFGYITAGSSVYLIEGGASGQDGREVYYSNINNVRGWLAIDFFPKLGSVGTNHPYVSFEITLSPEADINKRAPIREAGFTISIGSISQRLYGEEKGPGWEP